MRRHFPIASTLAMILAGCASGSEPGVARAPVEGRATTQLRAADGALRGTARLTERAGATMLVARVVGLAPGTYAIHLHGVGRCDGPDFTSAGPHWNPTSRAHGFDAAGGHHLGDLPNLVVGADGRGEVRYRLATVALSRGENAILDADGTALIVHAEPDDYRSQPAGAAGARIACGVVGR